jgi:predicted short-subunit dehydrogenase-like oxidoreductase (DUF2520 family)
MIAARPLPPPAVVVGSGRLARALAEVLLPSARPGARFGGREALASPGEVLAAVASAGPGVLLLLAVRDDAIAPLAEALAGAPGRAPAGAAVIHLSGALDLRPLEPLSRRGFLVGSCHPLQTFTGTPADAGRCEGIAFAVEGAGAALASVERLAQGLGGRTIRLAEGARALYHLAASLGANGLTGLVGASRDALVAAGLAPRDALDALGPLLRTALEESLRLGPEAALTGPAARGDEATLELHRGALRAWDASRTSLLEALVREQRRLAGKRPSGAGC